MAYQTHGDPQSPGRESSPSLTDAIPLVCFICPKNTHFSDLSHLLTHISSKGHLHNMFQLTLSRDVDESAAVAMEEFESWFQKNGIGALLRARKTAREQRGSQQRRSQASTRGARSAGHGRSSRGGRSNRRGRGRSHSYSRQANRQEEEEELDAVKFESDDDNDEEISRGHGYHPSSATSYSWHQDALYSGDPGQYPGNHFGDLQDEEDDSSKYEASDLYSPFPVEGCGTPDTIEDDTGALILKGVVYPGMAGFDSATEKDRRMRNQKKDPAVLMKLETNSQLVTRAEEVLDTNLAYQRTRDVYDDPSIDGSMDEDEDEPVIESRPKRRPNRSKPSASNKLRPTARARKYAQPAGRGRDPRSTRQIGRPAQSVTARSAPSVSSATRLARSSLNHNRQLPLHAHGFHTDMGPARHLEGLGGDLNSSDGFKAHIHTPIGETLRRQQHDRLPDLALRPGNPNSTFASPTPGFKKSPSRYAGKENGLLLNSPASSFNPYLHPQNDVMEPNNFNPLCPQPRDGFGYRLYSIYDEDPKPSGQTFHPVNNNAYDAGHLQGMTGAPYHGSQAAGDEFTM